MSTTIQLAYAILSYIALWAISWWGAIPRGWGDAESAHDPANAWLYARRALLVAASLIGVVLIGGETLASYGWSSSLGLPIALVLGLAMGFSNKGGFKPTGITPVILALLHTFAVELYFRGYLFHHLGGLIGAWALPLSALLYGLYYLTVHTVWASGSRGRLIGAISFSILGMIFAGCYTVTGSFFGAWLAHFGAVIHLRPARRQAVMPDA